MKYPPHNRRWLPWGILHYVSLWGYPYCGPLNKTCVDFQARLHACIKGIEVPRMFCFFFFSVRGTCLSFGLPSDWFASELSHNDFCFPHVVSMSLSQRLRTLDHMESLGSVCHGVHSQTRDASGDNRPAVTRRHRKIFPLPLIPHSERHWDPMGSSSTDIWVWKPWYAMIHGWTNP
jgi:hypothetical protein